MEGFATRGYKWEDWEVLKDVYHLEDKVFFDEGGNVRKQEPNQQRTTENTHQ